MGDSINHLLDNLMSLLWRIIDLPLFFLLPGLIVFILFLYWVCKRLFKAKWEITKIQFLVIMMFFFGALLVDKKTSNLKSEINALYDKFSSLSMGQQSITVSNNLDELVMKAQLEERYGDTLEVTARNINECTDLLVIKRPERPAVVHLAVIDLTYPGLSIEITPELKEKYLTSVFAKERDCFLAINGEAGMTMEPGCGLGEWVGNWIVKGNKVMMADSKERPTLVFNKQNLASYEEQVIVDTVGKDNTYNAIWGRRDILVDNEVIPFPPEKQKSYSRTVMGIDETGTKLYLMIVDGKRPDYSVGLRYEECAELLSTVGANNAMACDQGGSSCLYLRDFGGIVNRPADSEGTERVVYTHFGLALK